MMGLIIQQLKLIINAILNPKYSNKCTNRRDSASLSTNILLAVPLSSNCSNTTQNHQINKLIFFCKNLSEEGGMQMKTGNMTLMHSSHFQNIILALSFISSVAEQISQMNMHRSPTKKELSAYNEFSYRPKYFHLNQSPFSSKQQSTKQEASPKGQAIINREGDILSHVNQAFFKTKNPELGQKNLHVASTQALIKHSPQGFLKKKTGTKYELKDKKSSQKYLQYFELRNDNQRIAKGKNKFIKKLSDSGDSEVSYNSNNSANSQGNIKFSFRSFGKDLIIKSPQTQNTDIRIIDKPWLKDDKKEFRQPDLLQNFYKKNDIGANLQETPKKKWYPQSAKKLQPTSPQNIPNDLKKETQYNLNLSPRGFQRLQDLQTNIRKSVSPRNKEVYSPTYKNNFNNKIIERKVTPHKKNPKYISPSSKQNKEIQVSSEKELFFHRKTISKINNNSKHDHSISFSKDKSELFHGQNPNAQYSINNKSGKDKRHRNSIDHDMGRRRAISKCDNNRLTLLALNSEYPEYFEFIILKKIAEHKESVVVLCIELASKAIFCIKKCRVSSNNLNQLIRQHKVGNTYNHPNLVQTFCTFIDKDSFYIVMEYMEGGTMLSRNKDEEKLKRINSINTRQPFLKPQKMSAQEKQSKNRSILRQILEGVKFLHEHGIIHRDIKPQNIYMAHDNYKIGDFGSSTYLTSCEYVGTLDYAAPEIMLKEKYTQTIDIWSIGCVAYELETGRPPFYHIDRNQTIRRIVNAEYDISAIANTNLRNLIMQMLFLNGSKRISAQNALKHPYFIEVSLGRNRI